MVSLDEKEYPKFPKLTAYPFGFYTAADNTLNNCEI